MNNLQENKENLLTARISIHSDSIRGILHDLADENYRKFSSSLLPGTKNILGVRLPFIRKLAKKIAREDWRLFLQESWARAYETKGEDVLFEEKMLHGMILGYVRNVNLDELFHYCRYQIHAVDNWSLCDSFCSSLKTAKKSPAHADFVWNFLQPYFVLPDIPTNEFQVRFALVMLLTSFLSEENIGKIFEQIAKTTHSGYYVKMAKAWVLSMCYVQYPHVSGPLLFSENRCSRNLNLDEFTWKKTIQKIGESKRCIIEQKKAIMMCKH